MQVYMAIGPCRPRTVSCLNGPPCLSGRACTVLVPALRPKARPVGRLAVPCHPLGTAIFTVPGRPTAQQAKKHLQKTTKCWNTSFSNFNKQKITFSFTFTHSYQHSHSYTVMNWSDQHSTFTFTFTQLLTDQLIKLPFSFIVTDWQFTSQITAQRQKETRLYENDDQKELFCAMPPH